MFGLIVLYPVLSAVAYAIYNVLTLVVIDREAERLHPQHLDRDDEAASVRDYTGEHQSRGGATSASEPRSTALPPRGASLTV